MTTGRRSLRGFRRVGRAARPGALAAVLAMVLVAGLPMTASSQVRGPSAAALTVTPDTLLLNDQIVTVAGTGYPPESGVAMAQCRADAGDAGDCDPRSTTFITSDASGAFSVGLRVRRLMRVGADTIDCATPGACIVGAGVGATGVPGAGAPIQFDPAVPLPPPPTVAVDPSSMLLDDQLVTVTGAGYEPGFSVGVVQCRAPSSGAQDCDLDTLLFVITSPDGSFTLPFTVRRFIQVGDQTLDCAEPGLCEIGAGSGPENGAQAAISFASDATPIPSAPPPPVTGNTSAVPTTAISAQPRFTG